MKRFGDRRDGVRVRKINGMNHIMYHIKPKRSDSEVYIDCPVDVTELVKYMDKINKKKDFHLTYFHVFCTAIAKTIYNKPLLNRFVVNGHFYDRNEVSIAYVAKTKFEDEAQELLQVLKVEKDDNLFSVSERLSKKVKGVRNSKTNDADDLVSTLGNLPKFLRAFIVAIFKFMDNHGLVPKSLTNDLIYYSSVIVSNLGSIGCKTGIHHNLTNFGTSSILITMGTIYKKEVINDDGKKEIRDFCNFGMTLDERIADGFYMVNAVKFLENILGNPKSLEDRCDAGIKIK